MDRLTALYDAGSAPVQHRHHASRPVVSAAFKISLTTTTAAEASMASSRTEDGAELPDWPDTDPLVNIQSATQQARPQKGGCARSQLGGRLTSQRRLTAEGRAPEHYRAIKTQVNKQ